MTSGAPWLLRAPDSGALSRVFCFPYSGVGASMFAQWPQWIGGAEVCAVQFPARENRIGEAHFGTYEGLAHAVINALGPFFDRPFVLFGHCSGALPAFETAILLAERGLRAPDRLVVSAQVAPHDCPFDRLLDLDDDGLRGELDATIQSRGSAAHPELVEIALRVLRDDLSATRSYRRSQPARLSTMVTAVHWDDDAEIEQHQLEGWLHYSDRSEVVVMRGGHYKVLEAPQSLQRLLCAPGTRTNERYGVD